MHQRKTRSTKKPKKIEKHRSLAKQDRNLMLLEVGRAILHNTGEVLNDSGTSRQLRMASSIMIQHDPPMSIHENERRESEEGVENDSLNHQDINENEQECPGDSLQSSSQSFGQSSTNNSNKVELTLVEGYSSGVDDYSFLVETHHVQFQQEDSITRVRLLNIILSKSQSIWFMRSRIFTLNHSRESAREETLDKYFDHATGFSFVEENLTNDEVAKLKDLVHMVFEDRLTCWKCMNQRFRNLDRLIHNHIRGWVEQLKININEFQTEEVKIWYFRANRDVLKKISPYFDDVDDTCANSIFPLFACLIAISTSPYDAVLDQRKVFTIINKLLNGEKVKKNAIFSLLTTPFMATVAAVLQNLAISLKLRRGPQIAKKESLSTMGQASAIACYWWDHPTIIPSEFNGIHSSQIKKYIFEKLRQKLRKRKESSLIEQENTLTLEYLPSLDDL